MADRPTPEDPSQQPADDTAGSPPPAPTEPLPPTAGPGAAPGAGPPPPTGQLPPAQPTWSSGAPGGQGATWTGAAPAPARPSTPRRLWGEATATTGSRIALAAAAVLGVVVLLAGIGLVGSVVVHRIDRAGFVLGDDDERGWRGDERGREHGMSFGDRGRGNGNGEGRAQGRGGDQQPGTPGRGRGRAEGLGGGAGLVPGLGAVLHGEFTTTLTGEPAVMLFQVGEVTAVTAGESLTVRSTDGFEATYALDAATTGSSAPAAGDLVRVLAAEEGRQAVLVQVVGADD